MALSHAILTSLLEHDLTGYELAKQFDTSLAFVWSASHQQIYQTLKQLHQKQLVNVLEVSQQSRPSKRVYSLNEAGRNTLDAWVQSETKPRANRDELYVKLYSLGYSDTHHIERALAERQQQSEEKLQLYLKIRERGFKNPSSLDKPGKGKFLALLAGIKKEESNISWCQCALHFLQDLER